MSDTVNLTFADLFAGIGGFHLAFSAEGAKCVLACEIDKAARAVYQKNFYHRDPDFFESGAFAEDIREIDVNDLPDFDVLCAGFPCQPFSQAGFKRGFEETREDRGNMFFHICRILQGKRPKAFFLENVRHLFKHDNGKTFEIIRQALTETLGYSLHYQIVKASDYGLPQHRPRLYMVGFDRKIFGESADDFIFPDPIPLKITLSEILGGHCDKKIGYTLRVGGARSGLNDRRNWDTYLVNNEAKRIHSSEGKKLMGFPDDFEFTVTEAQAMKQLGNSVAVDAVREVSKKIIKKINDLKIIHKKTQIAA